jgi:hypothetical protein
LTTTPNAKDSPPKPKTQNYKSELDLIFTAARVKDPSAVLTNVQGPSDPVYFAGTKIAGVVPWVPAAGTIGMGIDIFSYNGGVTVSLQVDAGLIPDPDTIIADYEREVEALRRLEPTRPAKRAKRARAATAAKATKPAAREKRATADKPTKPATREKRATAAKATKPATRESARRRSRGPSGPLGQRARPRRRRASARPVTMKSLSVPTSFRSKKMEETRSRTGYGPSASWERRDHRAGEGSVRTGVRQAVAMRSADYPPAREPPCSRGMMITPSAG